MVPETSPKINDTGLPPGSGTPQQGAVVYTQKCQACHGEKGAGQPNDQLVGGQGTLTSANPVRTIGSYWPYATTVFDYVRATGADAESGELYCRLSNFEVGAREMVARAGSHGSDGNSRQRQGKS
jgi:hypothetical protein